MFEDEVRTCVHRQGMSWHDAADYAMEQLAVESPEPPRRRHYHYHDFHDHYYEEDYFDRRYSDEDSFGVEDDFY